MIEQFLTNQIVEYAVQNPELVGGLLAGGFGVGTHYKRTGRIPLGRLPYKHFRELLRDFGNQYFATSRPRGVPVIVAKTDPTSLQRLLRNRHYESGDLVSYEYSDEKYNLRRPDGYATDPVHGGDVRMENHIRIFETDDGNSLCLAHYEPNRFSETTEHLKEQGMSWSDGRDQTEGDLQALDIEYETYESETDSDVTVVTQ